MPLDSIGRWIFPWAGSRPISLPDAARFRRLDACHSISDPPMRQLGGAHQPHLPGSTR